MNPYYLLCKFWYFSSRYDCVQFLFLFDNNFSFLIQFISNRTHPNGVTTIVNGTTTNHEPSSESFQPETLSDEDCYGKIMLKGKLLPRLRKMKRKPNKHTENDPPPTLVTELLPPNILTRNSNSFDTTESEKIPIIGSIGPIDIDAGQLLLFGEVNLLSSIYFFSYFILSISPYPFM